MGRFYLTGRVLAERSTAPGGASLADNAPSKSTIPELMATLIAIRVFCARGTVRFSDTKIHGSFSCKGGKLIKGGENDEVLMVERTEIGGGMLWLDMSGDGGVC